MFNCALREYTYFLIIEQFTTDLEKAERAGKKRYSFTLTSDEAECLHAGHGAEIEAHAEEVVAQFFDRRDPVAKHRHQLELVEHLARLQYYDVIFACLRSVRIRNTKQLIIKWLY